MMTGERTLKALAVALLSVGCLVAAGVAAEPGRAGQHETSWNGTAYGTGYETTDRAARPRGTGAAADRQDWAGVLAEDLWIVHNGEMPKSKAQPIEMADWQKPLPLSFTVDYALVSDHVWRGINFSEYPGEGREKPNHQLGVGAEYDTRLAGIFGAAIWFNWFGGLSSQIDRGSSSRVQEADYTAYWRVPIRSVGLMLELGASSINWPPYSGDRRTYELYARAGWDDSALWRRMGCDVQSSFLNPYVFYALDCRATDWGSWLEVGIKPKWVLADIPTVRTVPVVRDMYISPTLALAADHRYLGQIDLGGAIPEGRKSTRLANLVYGLEVGYDVGSSLRIPKHYGTVVIAGFLNYSQAFRDDILNDEFWGGFKVAYAW